MTTVPAILFNFTFGWSVTNAASYRKLARGVCRENMHSDAIPVVTPPLVFTHDSVKIKMVVSTGISAVVIELE